MHKRLFLILFPICVLFLSLAPLAQALVVYRDAIGQIMVYEGSVLGQSNRPQPVSPGNSAAAPGQEVRSNQAQPQDNKPQPAITERYLIRRYASNDNKQVKIQPGLRNNLEAQVKVKNQGEDSQIRTMEMTENIEAEQIRLRLEQSLAEGESAEGLGAGNKLQDRSSYKELLIEKEGNQFKFNSNGTVARTGAQFILDQESGLVSIVTPSGNTHDLKHFPDEAIAVMQEKGKLTLLQEPAQDPEESLEPEPTADESDESGEAEEGDDQTELADLATSPTTNEEPEPENYELELTQNDEGEVVYRLKAKVRRNFLGLIPWESTQQAELNDATGEVTIEETQSLLSQLFVALSTTE